MYIDSFYQYDHRIYGNYRICLSKDGEPYEAKQPGANKTKPQVEIEDADANKYTYIIGDNGVGKSTFLRAIWKYVENDAYSDELIPDYHRSGFKTGVYVAQEEVTEDGDRHKYAKYFRFNKSLSQMKICILSMLYYANENRNILDMLKSYLSKEKASRFTIRIQSLGYAENLRMEALRDYIKGGKKGNARILESDIWSYCRTHGIYVTPKDIQFAIKNSKFCKDIIEAKVNSIVIFANLILNPGCVTKDVKEELSSLIVTDYWLLPALEQLGIIRLLVEIDGVSVSNLSGGEQTRLLFFSYFSRLLHGGVLEDVLILIEEPENSLHLKWQKEIPEMLRVIIEDIYHIKKSHVIVTTHSPVLISQVNSADSNRGTVLAFKKDSDGFRSEKVPNIQKYCIEQVMMDVFGYGYRSIDEEKKIYDDYSEKANDGTMKITELHREIRNLYYKVVNIP